jgi:hypothetical protein
MAPVSNVNRHSSGVILLASVLAVVVATGIGGCGYFHPARSENPNTGGPAVPIDLSTYDGTLSTLQSAVQAKGLQSGDVAYRACFADSTAPTTPAFHAFFDPANASSWVSSGHLLPTDWTLKNEAPFYNVGPLSLVNLRPEIYQMTWDTTNDADVFGTNYALLHRHYLIVAIGQGGDVAGVVAKGYADLTLVQSSTGNWVIVLWNDKIDGDPTLTWGQRRLESQSQ